MTLLLSLTGSQSLFAQNAQDSLLKQSLLQKSKDQRAGAWVMLVVGGAAFAGGLLYYTTPASQEALFDGTGAAISVVGTLLMLGSIPVFNAARRNEQKAMLIAFDSEQIMIPGMDGRYTHFQPAVSLKINLGRSNATIIHR